MKQDKFSNLSSQDLIDHGVFINQHATTKAWKEGIYMSCTTKKCEASMLCTVDDAKASEFELKFQKTNVVDE